MKMRWVEGPLDGCEEEIPRPRSVWVGPDTTDPNTKVVVYLWFNKDEYRFNQDATDWANEQIQARLN